MNNVSGSVLAYIEAQVGKAQYSRTKRMEEGFYDCASIVYRAYKAAGVKLTVEHSTSTYEVYAKEFRLLWPARYEDIGKKYAPKNILQQLGVSGGEHVFYCMDSATKRANRITHISTVRAGGKQIVHARNTTVDVCFDAISYGNDRIVAVVEYIGTDATPVISRELKKGCKGQDVYALELQLESLGYYCGITSKEKATGIGEWGSTCEKAFRAWQARHPECGTNGKPDGKCGQKSAVALGFVWKG